MKTFSYLTRKKLERLNNKAIKKNFSRALNESAVNSLESSAKYPIISTYKLSHKSDEPVRCEIVLDAKPTRVFLDILKEDLNLLPITRI